MCAGADILTSYRTTPHVDMFESAHRACQLLDAAMRGTIAPKLYVARLPMLAGMDMGRTLDPDGPMCRLQAAARAIEQRDPGHLCIEMNAGYYYSDLPEAGPSVVVTGDGADPRFQATADGLMRTAWETREHVSISHVGVAAAVEEALRPAVGAGPLILVDYTDGPAGGGYGDGTALLTALLAANIPGCVVGPIADPIAVKQAIAAGEGATLQLEFGGRWDPAVGGAPVVAEVTVVRISDGTYVRRGPLGTGTVGTLGDSVRLRVGTIDVLLSSERIQPEDREQYRLFGIEPEQLNVLACKGINHFRADFEPIARKLVFVDTGGLVAVDFTRFPFRHVRRPIWPLDPVAALAPA